MHVSLDDRPLVEQRVQGRLRRDGLKECEGQLPQQTPCARAGQAALAQCGESSNASISGSSSKIISKCARMKTLAVRGSLFGGPFRPMTLLRRLKASSTRQRKRYKAKTSAAGNAEALSDVTNITHS